MSDENKIVSFDRIQARTRLEVPRPWERWHDETSKAYSAFTLYLAQGSERSLRRVAEECTKSESLIRRWSAKWNWRERSVAHDRYETRVIHEKLLAQLARLRERDLKTADSLDEKTQLRLDTMRADEIDALSPMELATLIRVSCDLKYKACDVSAEEATMLDGFPANLSAPVFIIQTIPERPVGYVYVRFGDDPIYNGWTWIKEEDVAEYRKAHPDHTVIA